MQKSIGEEMQMILYLTNILLGPSVQISLYVYITCARRGFQMGILLNFKLILVKIGTQMEFTGI